jgi:hypothetical protein
MSSLFLFIQIILLCVFINGEKTPFLLSIKSGTKSCAIYHSQVISDDMPWFRDNSNERLLQILSFNEQMIEKVNQQSSSFVVRSSDLVNRLLVTVSATEQGDVERPYFISIVNLAFGDREFGNKPVELQHGDSGFIWIDGLSILIT